MFNGCDFNENHQLDELERVFLFGAKSPF